jgi:hypothetical protein
MGQRIYRAFIHRYTAKNKSMMGSAFTERFIIANIVFFFIKNKLRRYNSDREGHSHFLNVFTDRISLNSCSHANVRILRL